MSTENDAAAAFDKPRPPPGPSPDEPARPITLAQAIEHFLADPTTGTGHTLRTYETGLRRLLAFAVSAGRDAATAPASLVNVSFALAWVAWLLDDQLVSERTLLTYLAGFSRFVVFLHSRSLTDLSADDVLRVQTELRQVRRVHRPPSRQVRAPSEEDTAALARAARAAPGAAEAARDERAELRRLRDIAMLELLRSSGIRVGELVALRRRDLEDAPRPAADSDDGQTSTAAARRLRVMGKGRRERWAYADADAWAAIRAYLQARAALDQASGRNLAGLPLFARHDKGAGSAIKPLSTRTVQLVVEDLAGLAGLAEKGISPHSLRHYFATRVLRITGNLAVVQDLLDHRSPETTRIYAEVDETQKQQAHSRAFGGERGGGEG